MQSEISQRCIELSGKNTGIALDIGCGSGIGGLVLEENNFNWVGVDISEDMLSLIKKKNVIKCDIGDGLPFKPGVFDLSISVSCIQWLFQSYKTEHSPLKRIRKFFTDLHMCMKLDGVVVIQVYCTQNQCDILQKIASGCGFHTETIVDSPNTKKVKTYLVLRMEERKMHNKRRNKKVMKRKTWKNKK